MTETLPWHKVGTGQVWFDDVDSRGSGETKQRLTTPDPESWSGSLPGPFVVDEHVSAELIEDLPRGLVEAYADRAAGHAVTRQADPGVWFASVVGLEGAWGDGDTPEAAEATLHEALIGWVAVKRRLGHEIPAIDGLDLNIPRSHSA